jgi:hypothetical protein
LGNSFPDFLAWLGGQGFSSTFQHSAGFLFASIVKRNLQAFALEGIES